MSKYCATSSLLQPVQNPPASPKRCAGFRALSPSTPSCTQLRSRLENGSRLRVLTGSSTPGTILFLGLRKNTPNPHKCNFFQNLQCSEPFHEHLKRPVPIFLINKMREEKGLLVSQKEASLLMPLPTPQQAEHNSSIFKMPNGL